MFIWKKKRAVVIHHILLNHPTGPNEDPPENCIPFLIYYAFDFTDLLLHPRAAP